MSDPVSNTSRKSHFKSRNGCQRCKARKVKCDEIRPRCGACVRHGVSCEYSISNIAKRPPPARNGERLPSRESQPNQQSKLTRHRQTTPPIARSEYSDLLRNPLELRLLYQFLIYTCHTIAPNAHEMWVLYAPPLAFRHGFLLDAMLAIAADHLATTTEADVELAETSREYYQRTLAGHQKAINNIDDNNGEAALLTSSIVSVHTLSLLGRPTEDTSTQPDAGYLRWLHVGRGAGIVWNQCRELFNRIRGPVWLVRVEPILMSDELMYAPSNRDGLEHLLEWGVEYESISALDKETYEKSLSFIGSVRKSVTEGEERPMVTCRRINACPSVFPLRFAELVKERRPRALAILAHLFGAIALIKADIWWLRGIPEVQIPIIRDLLPSAWKRVIEEPLRAIQDENT